MFTIITRIKKYPIQNTWKITFYGCFILAAFFYFYNLNWGAPYYFHPDERNIASAVTRLRFPSHMNPEFFAYGSLPIYTIYFLGSILNHFSTCSHALINCEILFPEAIILSRFLSACLGLGILFLLFIIGNYFRKNAGIIAVVLGTFSTGFIQFSHFGTFELWLTFFSLLLYYLCIFFFEKRSLLSLFCIAIVTGCLVGIKVSSIALIPLPLATLLVTRFSRKNSSWKNVIVFIKDLLLFFLIGIVIYGITNPYVFIDTKSFIDSMHYESSVALGTLPVFYTGEFIKTIPVLFQFIHVFPFLINPVLTVLFLCCFMFISIMSVKKHSFQLKLLIGFFLILFLSQAILFVKWTRYMVPTLPFIYLSIAFTVSTFYVQKNIIQRMTRVFVPVILSITILFGVSYFILTFVEKDTRIMARDFAKDAIPQNSSILSEVYDLGITPFNDSFPHIDLYNVYDLEQSTQESNDETLKNALTNHQYIILPSQRIFKTRLMKPETFPKGYLFYDKLRYGKLSYKKIYQSPCDIFCQIVYLGDPVFRYEETANVFDRPVVQIFERTL